MYLNDLEQELEVKGASGIDIGMVKLFLLLYADDIVIFGKNTGRITEIFRYTWRVLQQMEAYSKHK